MFEKTRRHGIFVTCRAGGAQTHEAFVSGKSFAALCSVKYYIATLRYVKIHFFCIPNITEGLVCHLLPFKWVVSYWLVSSIVLIPSLPACITFLVCFLAVEAGVGQDESNSTVARIIFKEVSSIRPALPLCSTAFRLPCWQLGAVAMG